MANVEISYKGNTIASMNASGSKTLKTAGKYCEGDIGVEYSAPTPTLISKSISSNGTYNAASDGADGYSGVTVNVPTGVTSCITATLTVTSAKGNQDITLISGNSFIAANYNSPKAFALVVKTSDLQMNGINMAVCTNQQFGVLSSTSTTGVYGWFNGNSETVSEAANRITHPLSTQSTTVGNMYATASGNLVLRVGGGINALQVGDYFIIFGVMGEITPTPSVTNYLQLSQYPIGTTSGVMDSKRWNSSGQLKDKEAATPYARASGYIPIVTNDVVRMSGILFGANTVQKNTTAYIQEFDSNGSYILPIHAGQLSSCPTSLHFMSNIQYDNDGNVIQFTYTGSSGYLTICSNSSESHGGIPDDAILTINEEI